MLRIGVKEDSFESFILDVYNRGDMSKDLLQKRKKQFKVRPYILLVFDEAQEFIPDLSNSRGIDNECSRAVEALLRQGRKY
jgi:uncharacterized protein